MINELQPVIKKNDKIAIWLIGFVSLVVFIAIVILSRVKIASDFHFDIHIFAKINAIINSIVSALLIAGLITVKRGRYRSHKMVMLIAMFLSALFLISYVCHHLFTGDTRFGGTGSIRYLYFFILITHIILAAVILPFILFTTYRGLTGEWMRHRKIAKITWPIWLYVSISGVIVYLMISPYY